MLLLEARRNTFYNIYEKWLANLIIKILRRLIEAGVNGVSRLATNGETLITDDRQNEKIITD